jgi:hypothetical protein
MLTMLCIPVEHLSTWKISAHHVTLSAVCYMLLPLLLLLLPLLIVLLLPPAGAAAAACCMPLLLRSRWCAAAAAAVLVMPPVVVTASCLQLQQFLPPAVQCAVVDVLHHHEHICHDKVPGGRVETEAAEAVAAGKKCPTQLAGRQSSKLGAVLCRYPHHKKCISMESCIHSAAIRHKQDLLSLTLQYR